MLIWWRPPTCSTPAAPPLQPLSYRGGCLLADCCVSLSNGGCLRPRPHPSLSFFVLSFSPRKTMGRRPWFPYTLEQQVERKCLNSIAVRLFDLIGDQTENGMNPKFHTHRKKNRLRPFRSLALWSTSNQPSNFKAKHLFERTVVTGTPDLAFSLAGHFTKAVVKLVKTKTIAALGILTPGLTTL